MTSHVRTETGPQPRSLLQGLSIQLRVINALLLRDPTSRYGHHNLGFFWVVGEPLLLTSGVMGIWTLTGATHGHDISIAAFALTGYSFITLWRHIVFRSIRAMSATSVLMYHRQIRRLDILVAWAAIETLGVTAGFVISLSFICLLGINDGINDPLLILGGLFYAAWFSFAFGMIAASLSEMNEAVHHLIQPIMYLTLPLTGVFTMVDWLPVQAQQILSYSPLANCIEMIRNGVLPPEIQTHWSASYLTICCSVLTIVGLPLFRAAEKFVET